MKESTAWALALTWWLAWSYLFVEPVRNVINTVAWWVDSALWVVWKWLAAASPILLPLWLAAGSGWLAKKLVWDKVDKAKWQVDYYWNTAAIWWWAAALWIFWSKILWTAAWAVTWVWTTLLAGTAMYKKYWFYGATLTAATAATMAYWTPYYLLAHLWMYWLDKIWLWKKLRDMYHWVNR